MATYLLEGTASARLARRPLLIRLSVHGNGSGVRLVARRDGDQTEAPGVRRHDATMLILPRVEQEIVIAAIPDAGRERFGPGTKVHVTIGPDGGNDPDVDVAKLAERDVSGLTSIELATVAPAGIDEVEVTTRLIQADAALPPLAARARVSCRGVLGVDRLPPAKQLPVTCIVDTSASMGAHVLDGTLSAAADIVAGIAAVVSGPQPVRALLADEVRTAVPDGPPADLSARVREAVEATGYGVGADVEGAIVTAAGAGSLTVALTDAAGAPPAAATGPSVRVVLSASRSALSHPGFIGAVCPPAPTGQNLAGFLTSRPELLDEIVAGIVAPIRGR